MVQKGRNSLIFTPLPLIKMYKDVEKVKVMGSDGKIYERTPCEIYTRCMGYIRPMSGRNIGKKAEGMSRKYFTEERVNNSDFLAKYMTAKTLEK